MRNSKFIQLDSNVLMEYIYDDNYLRGDSYIVSKNLTDLTQSYSVKNTIDITNKYSNQYVTIDPIRNSVGVKDSTIYNFLQDKEYSQNLPIKHDRIKLHFPVNYNFSEYGGCYLKVLALDSNEDKLISLSQFFFDKQDQNRFNRELEISSPPQSINGSTWGKFIEVSFPSINAVSNQILNNIVSPNTINYNLTSNIGLSRVSPVMVEFGFIAKKTILNDITTYILSSPLQTSFPQTPDYQSMGIKVEPSAEGDWFDIYGIYNGNISEFNSFITNSVSMGKRYFAEYSITLFEENIKGKTINISVYDDFNEKLEYRPIIKYSSTTAVIDVSMRIIDQVDGSVILRTASYGILPKEINKYSRSLVRINTKNVKSAKIYNLRSGASLSDAIKGLNKRNYAELNNQLGDSNSSNNFEVVKVPTPVLVSTNNVVVKSESSLLDSREWKGSGKLKLIINPFDNIIKFTIAKNVETKVSYFNLVDLGTISLKFKNFDSEISTDLYRSSEENDLTNGTVVFKLKKENVNSVRRIYQSGVNVFYITSTNESTNETSVIYGGTFIMSDSIEYVNELGRDFQRENSDVEIRRDSNRELAIVTRRRADENTNVNVTTTVSTQTISDVNIISDSSTTFSLINDPFLNNSIFRNF